MTRKQHSDGQRHSFFDTDQSPHFVTALQLRRWAVGQEIRTEGDE